VLLASVDGGEYKPGAFWTWGVTGGTRIQMSQKGPCVGIPVHTNYYANIFLDVSIVLRGKSALGDMTEWTLLRLYAIDRQALLLQTWCWANDSRGRLSRSQITNPEIQTTLSDRARSIAERTSKWLKNQHDVFLDDVVDVLARSVGTNLRQVATQVDENLLLEWLLLPFEAREQFLKAR
jgi:hypothetical protein